MSSARVSAWIRRDEHRPRALAIRYDEHLPLPIRAGHDRAGVPDRDPPDILVPVRKSRAAAADPFLRRLAADQRCRRRGDRAGAGIRVRDELVGLLALRRRRIRSAAGDGGVGGVLPRIDVPGSVAVRLEQAAQAVAPRVYLAGGDRIDAIGGVRSSRPTRGCSIPSVMRSTTPPSNLS